MAIRKPASLLATLLFTTAALAQTTAPLPTPPPPGATILKTGAQLVIVDVVVTDSNHRPVHGLKKQNFTLLEANNPQTLKSFEEHQPLSAAAAAKLPQLPPAPPGTFTNYNPAPANSAVNILLLDTLNTPTQSQTFVRRQLLQYLNNARPGVNVAIFGLSTRLVMLQGFTTNPELLKAAVLRQSNKSSPLLDKPATGGPPETAAELDAAMGTEFSADQLKSLQAFMDFGESVEDTNRTKLTLDALNQLAHFLSAIPGRKNLIWFSGGFPLSVAPDSTNPTDDRFIGMADLEQEYRETSRLFTTSQVAVYPVDARGLMLSAGSVVKDMQVADSHFTMLQMAYETGGHAFFNTNGLADAVADAIDDGSSFYTLAYSPSGSKQNGEFHKITVKLDQKGYQLEYRRGYFADVPTSTHNRLQLTSLATLTPAHDSGLVYRAMAHGVPASTDILFKARVLPSTSTTEDTPAARNIATTSGPAAARGPFRLYSVDFAVLPSDISYTVTPDGARHFHIEFLSLVYSPDGLIVTRAKNALNASFTPAQFDRLRQNGFPFHQEISVPVKGDYTLRLGIQDLSANRIGTTELSIATVKNLPPLDSPATPPRQLHYRTEPN
jgi:VWFA-related protein